MDAIDQRTVLAFEDVGMTYHTRSGETCAAAHKCFLVREGVLVARIGPRGGG